MKRLISEYISHYGILVGLIALITKSIKRVLANFIVLLFRICKISVKQNRFVLYSRPDYSDNSRVFAEFLTRIDGTEVFFITEKENILKLSRKYPCIKFIKKNSIFHSISITTLLIILTSKYVLTTHLFLYGGKSYKQQGQLFIKLWHGCSFKDNENKGERFGDYEFDKALVSGPLFIQSKMKFWGVDSDHIVPLGYPRYDLLMTVSPKAVDFRKKVIGDNNKLVIWMPTFRNLKDGIFSNSSQKVSNFPLINCNKEWELIDKYCTENKIKLLVKLHMLQLDYNINFNSFKNISILKESDLDQNNLMLYQLLAVTDGLITDYSSVAVDYLLVNKPIAYILDDFDLYKSSRGFIIEDPRNFMPGHHIYKICDLISFFNDIKFENDEYKDRRDMVKEKALNLSKHYCLDIYNYLISIKI